MKRLLIVVELMLASPAGADEARNDDAAKGGVDVALQSSQFAGLYYDVADLGPEARRSPDDVQLARELGNGAALVAQYVLAQVRAISQPGLQPEAPMPSDVWNRAWQEAGDYIC